MVGEVSKLVADALAVEREIYLPQVGSLYVARRAAKMLSSRRLQRAANVVDFSSSERGRSLVTILAQRCEVDEAAAGEVYERWLAKVSDDDMLHIEGVGVLKNKSFLVDSDFDKLLNPMGHEIVSVSRYSRHVVAWIVVAVCVVVLGGAIAAGLYFTGAEDIKESIVEIFSSKSSEPKSKRVEMPRIEERIETAEEPATATDTLAAMTSVAAEQVAAQKMEQTGGGDMVAKESHAVETNVKEPTVVSDEVTPLTSGRHYVVLGVYSTPENALRAVKQEREKGYELAAAYNYGKRFLVALLADDDMQRCSSFARQQRETYPNLWIYTAR